jgi:hypothetical protein
MKFTITPLVFGAALLGAVRLMGPTYAAAATPPTPVSSGTVTVVATDPTALVGASTGAFTFIRTGPTNADLQVPFVYSGTAVLGTDFNDATSTPPATPPGPRSVTIPKGLYAVDLIIQPLLNPANRGNKTVDITLDKVTLATAAMPADPRHSNAEVRIIDDTYNDTPPTVTLTSPADNSTFTLPATVTVTADVSDLEDVVQKVSFYAGDNFLGSATASPYTFAWVNPKVGQYDLFARAVDAAGKSTLSQPVHITVTGVTPTVSFTAPADKSSVEPHSDVPITVQATGAGTLTVRVTLDSAKVVGESSTAPYQFTWTNATPGKHTLTARVTDSTGQTASTSIEINVVDVPPTVQITNPTSGANFAQGTDITLTATATDPDDTVTDVTFWVNHRILGKGTTSQSTPNTYSFTWSGAKPDYYLIQAVATNSNGTKSTSDSVYISVSKP